MKKTPKQIAIAAIESAAMRGDTKAVVKHIGDPLFISGTVEVSGTADNPVYSGYWEDPIGGSITTVQFTVSGDCVVASVSKAGQIIAETEVGVVTY